MKPKRYYCLYLVVVDVSKMLSQGVFGDYTYLLKSRFKFIAKIKKQIYAKVLSNALRSDPKHRREIYITITEDYL